MGKIRMATAADTKAILDIYAPYIEHTNITFEYVAVSYTHLTLPTTPYV